jgi:uncharacterized protein with FMN-binding domain
MKRKHIIVLLVVLVAAAGIFIGVRSMLTQSEASFESLKNEGIAEVDLAAIDDGTYTGSYSAFPVTAEVSVTVKDHVITGIELLKHDNGQGAPAEVIPGKVVEAQSLQVDTVSGATHSSLVILKAIENALVGAGK